jgi:hypothetical protein
VSDIKLDYVVQRTPNGDRVGSLAEAIRFRTSVSGFTDAREILLAVVTVLTTEQQYRVAQRLNVPVAELFPHAVSGDRQRAKVLQKLENEFGKIE